jgi:monoamine oxidase
VALLARDLDVRLLSPVAAVQVGDEKSDEKDLKQVGEKQEGQGHQHPLAEDENTKNVTVVLRGGGALRCRVVVTTLPIGVLKAGSVAFRPPLDADKRAAIGAIGVALMNKVTLVFARAFWPRGVSFFLVLGRRFYAVDLAHITQSPALQLIYVTDAGGGARELEALDDAAVLARAMQDLRAVFGRGAEAAAVPEPIAHRITRWGADPFALGSYSASKVGTTRGHYRALARPSHQGRVLWAGEATSEHNATVHGAYLSGLRAAGEARLALERLA